MQIVIEIPDSEQLLKTYNINMDLIKDLKDGTVSNQGLDLLYKIVRDAIKNQNR